MKNATKFMTAVITLLSLVLMISVLPTEKEASLYTETIRLHILANSDSESDQELKLRIRDRLLAEYGEKLSAYDDSREAKESLPTMLRDIEADVDGWVKEYGSDYTSRVSIGEEWYERRSYGELSMPEGYYTSLKVELGEADGQNWWCVMYPPLCLDIATEPASSDDAILGYGGEAGALISKGKYTVRFRLLELAEELVSRLGR